MTNHASQNYFWPMTKYSKVSFVKERKLASRAYGPIWMIVYAILWSMFTENKIGEYENAMLLVVGVCVHAGLYISTRWSLWWRMLLDMENVANSQTASHAYCISDYEERSLSVIHSESTGRRFIEKDFVKMHLNEKSDEFERTEMPTRESLSFYCASTGLKDVKGRVRETMEIPVPSFFDLFKEHVVEPFFVFQLFCVLLWLMDEYWSYALMTLVMLVMLESQMVHRRIRDLKELRSVRPSVVLVQVKRDGKWISTTSDLVFPGDLISLADPQTPIPCDMVLVGGSALVNEEMLTGESVPVLKEALLPSDETVLDIEGLNRASVLFAGSQLVAVRGSKLIGFVLRTGFETAQGNLLVTILNASKTRVTASSKEAYQFIGVLVSVALVAAGYVVWASAGSGRSRFKLFLSVSHILTSVIPPEFPITLSLTVTLALAHLVRHQVFCTEPFRIPSAGRITHCALDKTGTLTSSAMVLDQVIEGEVEDCVSSESISGESKPMSSKSPSLITSSTTLAICQSLIRVRGEWVGDPLEQAVVKRLEESFSFFENSVSTKNGQTWKTQHRFPFASNLQRMSVVASTGHTKHLFLKGSPESVAQCLRVVPDGYHEKSRELAGKGLRVLALAERSCEMDDGLARREEAESNCRFVGFAAFNYTIKPGTVRTISALQNCGYKCVMITGDHPLTALHVAKQVGILTSADMPILDGVSVEDLDGSSELCVSGDPTPAIAGGLTSRVVVWARASPEHKRQIVQALNSEGRVCLFCGDGTNDVPALKEAAVGIALMARGSSGSVGSNGRQVDESLTSLVSSHASIAAPFAYRGDSTIKCLSLLVRSGRASLALVIQMYKILAVNSLITAFCLSILTIRGVKLGDTQTVVEALFMSVLSFLVSRVPPAKSLPSKPTSPTVSVFEPAVLASIFLQALLHVALMWLGQPATLPDPSFIDSKFEPSPSNSAAFIQLFAAHLVASVANFEGPPSLPTLPRVVKQMVVVGLGILGLVCSELIPSLNEFLELAPNAGGGRVGLLVIAHCLGGWFIARIVRK